MFYIIDLKGGASFSHFETLPHVLGVFASSEETEKALEICHAEMNDRLQKIRTSRREFKDIPKFPDLIIIIDEGGELAVDMAIDKEDRDQRKRIYKHLASIARIGREPRVHVIYGTQQPNAETLPTSIRGQLEATFCFRVENDIDAEIVLRHKGTAELLPHIPGRCIYKNPVIGEQTMQAFYVPKDMLERFIKSYRADYPSKNKLEYPDGESPSPSTIEFTEEVED